ncbi:uncharacterized protein LOC108049446 isoform X1 [Drosophila rhopaloa]|uniref:Uncharacterized protein LOC108049446 isoform X1 n=1 Tax=Drosophila rhopaloa TaxID=1041015 RepID=A0A6P4FLF6_DRORH|nr:uncharacterized protein LOC108049446 isoform X1 [Drosophila rhopaloa]
MPVVLAFHSLSSIRLQLIRTAVCWWRPLFLNEQSLNIVCQCFLQPDFKTRRSRDRLILKYYVILLDVIIIIAHIFCLYDIYSLRSLNIVNFGFICKIPVIPTNTYAHCIPLRFIYGLFQPDIN